MGIIDLKYKAPLIELKNTNPKLNHKELLDKIEQQNYEIDKSLIQDFTFLVCPKESIEKSLMNNKKQNGIC